MPPRLSIHSNVLCLVQEGILAAFDTHLDYHKATTCIACGLRTAADEIFLPLAGDRPDVPNVAILFTDGKANEDTEHTIDEALKITGIQKRNICHLSYVRLNRSQNDAHHIYPAGVSSPYMLQHV